MRKSRSLSKIHDLKRKNHQAEHEAQGLSIPSQAELSPRQVESSQAEQSRAKLTQADPS